MADDHDNDADRIRREFEKTFQTNKGDITLQQEAISDHVRDEFKDTFKDNAWDAGYNKYGPDTQALQKELAQEQKKLEQEFIEAEGTAIQRRDDLEQQNARLKPSYHPPGMGKAQTSQERMRQNMKEIKDLNEKIDRYREIRNADAREAKIEDLKHRIDQEINRDRDREI